WIRSGGDCRMVMLSASQCRCFRGSKVLINHEVHQEHEAKANSERSACPLGPSWLFLESLSAFFEGGGFAAQVGEDFTGEVKRTGDENWTRLLTRLIEGVGDRWSNGVG